MPLGYFTNDPQKDANENGAALARQMGAARKDNKLSGFYFVFNGEEDASYKKAGKAADMSAWEMARAARLENKRVELFKNMNGQIAARLVP